MSNEIRLVEDLASTKGFKRALQEPEEEEDLSSKHGSIFLVWRRSTQALQEKKQQNLRGRNQEFHFNSSQHCERKFKIRFICYRVALGGSGIGLRGKGDRTSRFQAPKRIQDFVSVTLELITVVHFLKEEASPSSNTSVILPSACCWPRMKRKINHRRGAIDQSGYSRAATIVLNIALGRSRSGSESASGVLKSRYREFMLAHLEWVNAERSQDIAGVHYMVVTEIDSDLFLKDGTYAYVSRHDVLHFPDNLRIDQVLANSSLRLKEGQAMYVNMTFDIPDQRTSCRCSIPMSIVSRSWRGESESHRKRESPFRSHILAMPLKSTLSLAIIGSTRMRRSLTFACKEQGSCMALMLVGTYVLRHVMTAFDINPRASCIA
ncbi:hypothetical protein VNO77_22768 [Canavalia gladiata]|uniref:Uncharacterized protein n=1 Tax=Canavalia gladiata TaxID=3824 RepID=A0AAN9QBA3_CANGL